MRASLLRLPLLLALLAPGLGARPLVDVTAVRPLRSGNVGETFLADSQGRTWFFKADGEIQDIQRYGNFEAEVLSAHILRRLGLEPPAARVVSIRGRPGAYLQTELVDPEFTGGGPPVDLRTLRAERPGRLGDLLERVDPTEVRLLQVADVLLGNGDRHDGNLFLAELPGGRVRVLPIDHNLALATPRVVKGYYNWHLTDGFGGVAPGTHPDDPGGLLYPRHATACGVPERLMRRNLLYQEVWTRSAGDPVAMGEYARIAEHVRRVLDDAWLEATVAALPDDAVTRGDPAARRAEILRLLKRRRNLLPRFFRDFAVEGGGRSRRGAEWLRRVVPERLRLRWGLGERDLAYLALEMFQGERFEPRTAYAHLRSVGMERLLARETVKALCAAMDAPFPVKELILADRQHQLGGYARAARAFWSRSPTARFRALHGDD